MGESTEYKLLKYSYAPSGDQNSIVLYSNVQMSSGGIFKESSLCCCLYLYYQKVQLGRCDCYYGDCSVAIFPKFSFYIFIRYKILSKIFNSNVLANCIENLAYGFWFASIFSHATSLWNSDLL